MGSRHSIRKHLIQTSALIERNIYLVGRFKTALITRVLNPFLQIIMPLIVFGTIFAINRNYQFGYWNSTNYLLFILIAFCVQLLNKIAINLQTSFLREKYWKTMQALMVAPINRYNLLFGSLLSELILISIPFFALFILMLLLYPISFLNVIIVLLLYLAIALIFGSIGLIYGILTLTKEGISRIFHIGLLFLFLLSCISYPLQIFPAPVQYLILLNPLYYIIDLIRLTWLMGIDLDLAINNLSIAHIISVSLFSIILPIISVHLFNIFYKRYGITGY